MTISTVSAAVAAWRGGRPVIIAVQGRPPRIHIRRRADLAAPAPGLFGGM